MKILVIRLSSIGDIVLTTPVVRCLKKQLNAEVHFITKAAYESIVANNPYIDKVFLYSNERSQLISDLKKENYDLVIDLHHNLRTFFIKMQLGKKAFSYNKLNIEKWLMAAFKINKLPAVHIVDRYLGACKALGIKSDGEGLDYFIATKDEVSILSLPPGFQNGYVAWVIGAKENTKQFPAEKINIVLSNIQLPVILLGGKEDKAKGDEIVASLTSDKIYNAAGAYSLNQSASIVKQAQLVVTNDTGLMHIAAAFKKKIISLWGNTIPEFGMYPYYGAQEVGSKIFEVKNLYCRPCSKIGYSKCPQGHFKCMRDINEGALAETIKEKVS